MKSLKGSKAPNNDAGSAVSISGKVKNVKRVNNVKGSEPRNCFAVSAASVSGKVKRCKR